MNATRIMRPPGGPEERAHLAFRVIGAKKVASGRDRAQPDEEMLPAIVPVSQRFRRLPEALLLTAGYYASRAPLIGNLLRRRH
jgi:hypothetical protein